MITGIVRERRGGVRGASPSGGGAARTVLASRAASHNEGVRNRSAPWFGDSPMVFRDRRAENQRKRGPGRRRGVRTTS